MAKKKQVLDEQDAFDEAVVEQKVLDEREIVKLGNLLNNYAFREYMWNRLAKCGIFDAGYREPASLLYYYEGRRTVGQEMLNEVLTHFPKMFTLMQVEANKRATERDSDA